MRQDVNRRGKIPLLYDGFFRPSYSRLLVDEYLLCRFLTQPDASEIQVLQEAA